MHVRVLGLAVLVGALATATDAGAQSLTPNFPAWERYFTVSSEPFERRGQPYLRGNITHRYGVLVTRVQLLVDSLDSSGKIVAQRVEWLAGSHLSGFPRRYLVLPIPEQASAYRASVCSFEVLHS